MKVKKRQHKWCALNVFTIAQSEMVELNEYMNLKSEQWLPKLSLLLFDSFRSKFSFSSARALK